MGFNKRGNVGRVLTFAVLLATLAFVSVGCVSAATIYVPDNYSTIQAAVNAASAGDTIIVRDGTYTENVDVNNDHLTIKSQNGSVNCIVHAINPDDNVFEVTADYVNISGFTMTGATGDYDKSGIYLGWGAHHCTLSNNNVSNNGCGICLWKSNSNTITDNTMNENNVGIRLGESNNNTITGNAVKSNNDDGIQLFNSSNNTITNNTANKNFGGIWLGNSNNNTITDNIANENDVGISLNYCNDSAITGNTANNNNHSGIDIIDSINNTITGNTANSNYIDGIRLGDSFNNTITDNAVNSNSNNGIALDNSSNNTFTNSTASGNSNIGIALYFSSNNTLTNNNVSSNTFGIDLGDSNNNQISDCQIYNNIVGINPHSSSNNLITNCRISNNYLLGIHLFFSANNNLLGNNFTTDGIAIAGDCLEHYVQNIDTTNTVNGKPLYYFLNQNDVIIDNWDIGQLILVNCTGFTIKNIEISYTDVGIEILYSSNVSITNCAIRNNLFGIGLMNSSYNKIESNTANNNTGFMVEEGGWPSTGILLFGSSHNIIKNNNASNNLIGISICSLLGASHNNTVTDNIASNNYYGIYLYYSSNNMLMNNTASNNDHYGICLENSSNNTIMNNIANNNRGFEGEENGPPPSTGILILGSHNIVRNNNASNNFIGIGIFSGGPTGDIVSVNNTIEGNIVKNNTGIISENKPSSSGILLGASHNVVRKNEISDNFFGIAVSSGPSGVILTDNTISTNEALNNTYGIYIETSSYTNIENNIVHNNTGTESNETAFGILLYKLNHSTINNNTANSNNGSGIIFVNSSYNIVSHNIIESNNATGMGIMFSNYNTISDNFAIFNAGDGIWLWNASGNIISGNNASNNTVHNGISLGASYNNTVINNIAYSNHHNGINLYNASSNNIVANNTLLHNDAHGISAHDYSNFNKIYHNNLINNSQNAIDESLNNSWDDGYPSGGNYWSDYTGADNYSGQNQGIPGSDGIGDTPYNISGGAGAKDNYPLMNPYYEKHIFDTGKGTYPSIMGTHEGTITPSCNITVSKLYTYLCTGTGGHTEYAAIYYSNGTLIAEAHWNGYIGDWRNISFNKTFTLVANETYNYTIRTGSYPQIIHAKSKDVTGGTITCAQFTDANGKIYKDWIPAIKLFSEEG